MQQAPPGVPLRILSVNCQHAKEPLRGSFGVMQRDGLPDIICCQEITDPPERINDIGFRRVAMGADLHGLNVAIYLRDGCGFVCKENTESQYHDAQKTTRASCMIEFFPKHNIANQFRVLVATVHFKAGENNKDEASKELKTLLDRVADKTALGHAAACVAGDFNWADTRKVVREMRRRFPQYTPVLFEGNDQLSGKSLMQSLTFKVNVSNRVLSVDSKDLPRTKEGHAVTETTIVLNKNPK